MPQRSSVYRIRNAMLFGSPERLATSRRGNASPDERKADSSRDACTTDLTRYGSRARAFCAIGPPFVDGETDALWPRSGSSTRPVNFAPRNDGGSPKANGAKERPELSQVKDDNFARPGSVHPGDPIIFHLGKFRPFFRAVCLR